MNNPKVSIIILNWNSLNNIVECLRSVENSDYSNYEIIIVDNGSVDGSVYQIKRLFPQAVVFSNGRNLGFAGGNNIGIKYSIENGSKYSWLLNNDTMVAPDTLKILIQEAEKDPKIGLLSPVIYYYSNREKIQNAGSYIDWKNMMIRDVDSLVEAKLIHSDLTCLFGTALLINLDIVSKVGLLNEKFFAYVEDLDYSLRSLRKGFSNKIVTNSRIFHKEHRIDVVGFKGLPAHAYYYITRNNFFFWMGNLRGWKKLRFIKKFLVSAITRVGYFNEINFPTGVDAIFDGAYSGFLNIGGRWDKKNKFPIFFKRLILWHPFLLADIIDGNFKKIIKDFNARFISLRSKADHG